MRSREKLGGDMGDSVAIEAEQLCAGASIATPASCQFGLMSGLNDPKHRENIESDLTKVDLILLAPDIARDSNFLKKATEANVRIEYSDVLLFKLVPSTMLIAIMGSAGKATVAAHFFEILQQAKQRVFTIDVEKGGVLAVLKNIKKDDIIIARMPEYLMDEYREARITPHIAILTYISKTLARMGKKFFGILEFQTYNSFVVASDIAVDMLKDHGGFQPKAKIIRTRSNTIPRDWHVRFDGAHMKENIALAVEAASVFKIDLDTIHNALVDVKILKGRIEKVKVSKKGIEFFNDTMSIRPESTLAALRYLCDRDGHHKVVLIIGGSYTDASYEELFANMTQYVSHLVVLPGSGSVIMRSKLEKIGLPLSYVKSIQEAVGRIREVAGKGDTVLFSPAFEGVGQYESRKERGEEFVQAVKEAY
jgi:UDP-N-acetylmuramoylalanine-D-glutamate ligase